MAVIARGWSVEGDRWELEVDGDAGQLSTMLRVTTADGRRLWGVGSAGPARPPVARLDIVTGSNDVGPGHLVVRVGTEVHAVVVLLSDGTREDLVLHDVPAVPALRVAALAFPRHLDIHRIDLYGADGAVLNGAVG